MVNDKWAAWGKHLFGYYLLFNLIALVLVTLEVSHAEMFWLKSVSP